MITIQIFSNKMAEADINPKSKRPKSKVTCAGRRIGVRQVTMKRESPDVKKRARENYAVNAAIKRAKKERAQMEKEKEEAAQKASDDRDNEVAEQELGERENDLLKEVMRWQSSISGS